ncbi:MAG: serine/threonine protein kinase, partial [Rhodoferax sp.]
MSAAPSDNSDTQALPSGIRLEEFEILQKIGEGGFSIVYKAWDLALEREVALKEYLPSSIAHRGSQTQVSVRAERNRPTFVAGLSSFVREAQTLASFNHPSLVRVFRFFHANGTAYMVMPLYDGRTLRSVVQEMATPPDEAWLKGLLHPLMDVLEIMHAQGWYHRDIAPDNIMLVDGETRPVLLDFGAARQVIGDMTQALTVVLKPGYAPIEQYAAIADIKQGPWTDVYALAATIHWTITGKTPPISAGRILQDTHIPLAISEQSKYSQPFLLGLDAALKVKPVDRTQNIAQFRANIDFVESGPKPAPADVSGPVPTDPDDGPPAPATKPAVLEKPAASAVFAAPVRHGMILVLLLGVASLFTIVSWRMTSREPNAVPSTVEPISASSSAATVPSRPVPISPTPPAKPLAPVAIIQPEIQPVPAPAPVPAASKAGQPP